MAQDFELDGIEGLLLAFSVGKGELPAWKRLLQSHAVVVEPVADASVLQVQLLAEVVHDTAAGVRVEGKSDLESLLLLIREEDSLLLGRASRAVGATIEVAGVNRRGSVRA